MNILVILILNLHAKCQTPDLGQRHPHLVLVAFVECVNESVSPVVGRVCHARAEVIERCRGQEVEVLKRRSLSSGIPDSPVRKKVAIKACALALDVEHSVPDGQRVACDKVAVRGRVLCGRGNRVDSGDGGDRGDGDDRGDDGDRGGRDRRDDRGRRDRRGVRVDIHGVSEWISLVDAAFI